MYLENVKAFYEKLENDTAFRTQIQSANSKEEYNQIVKAAGYDFTQEEFEEYTSQLLDSAADEDELQDLNEKELATVVGGFSGLTILFWWRRIKELHGVMEPPPAQPLYGVTVPLE
jgi:predicted ribosomally synthesized peptide with nif11-like leader